MDTKYIQKESNDSKEHLNEIDDGIVEHDFNRITEDLRQTNILNNDQLDLLKHIVCKHHHHEPVYQSYSISFKAFNSNKWNQANNKRKILEIFSVHQLFIKHNDPSSMYNIFDFIDKYIELNKHQKADFLEVPELLQLYLLINKPIDLYPIYIIHDDMKQIMNIVFSATYLVNYIVNNNDDKNDEILNVNIAIIPHRVQLAMNKQICYKHKLPDFSSITGCTKIKMSRNDESIDTNMIYQKIKKLYDETDIDKDTINTKDARIIFAVHELLMKKEKNIDHLVDIIGRFVKFNEEQKQQFMNGRIGFGDRYEWIYHEEHDDDDAEGNGFIMRNMTTMILREEEMEEKMKKMQAMKDIKQYLQSYLELNEIEEAAFLMKKEVKECLELMGGGRKGGRISIVVDRRSDTEDEIYFYPFYDNGLFESLFSSYLLIFTFNIHPIHRSVICYLWWALYQKGLFLFLYLNCVH